ncbi:MAG: hypothetical protein JNK61_06360 [Bacteroidia bacterium]|nr:hypothetical protein [Bacteroidia bacterium]HQV00371.1 hypothetical protein [Bacteroidia bacterium]
MYRFRIFHAPTDTETSAKYLEGHVNVLKDYGITNITSNNQEWMTWNCVYGIVAERDDGVLVGGIRVQIADGINMLPVEKAIGKMDPNIHQIVNGYINTGVGELCALWNAKVVAGKGLSLLLTRAGISIVNQIKCKTLMGICADYTMPMFRRVGFVVDDSLGDNGQFVYPNENYIARVLGILNAKDLGTSQPYDRERMLSLRNSPNQKYTEMGAKGSIEINYQLFLPN